MAKDKQRHIEVYAHWRGLSEPVQMGVLNATPLRGKEIFSFSYEGNWLNGETISTQMLDPSLQLLEGAHYPSGGQGNFGIFLDSAPDRWGRVLMDRGEAQQARKEGRAVRQLLESDYLLGVYDEHRIGGLRFRLNAEGSFLDNDKKFASPPWASLRELEHASLELEKEGAEKQTDYSKWLAMLIVPGGSLGGARPKASVIDEKKHLWIAKFPSIKDEYDVGAWEQVLYKLALKAKINISEAVIRQFNNKQHTFLCKRFDRAENGERIHFASAMTMLQRSDGDDYTQGVSYLHIAEFLMRFGAQTNEDLEQLWRRIVFYICASNVDDHLRNHGFLLKEHGWVLSPAYDINPVARGEGLKLNISESDNSQDLDLAREVSEYFRVNSKNAEKIIKEVVKSVKKWRDVAGSLGISPNEQEKMKRAFRVADNFKR